MVSDAKTLREERKKFRQQLFISPLREEEFKHQNNNVGEAEKPPKKVPAKLEMSSTSGKRNLLRLNLEIEKRNTGLGNHKTDSKNYDTSEEKCQIIDVNRNSVIDNLVDVVAEDVCEVTTTEITERKTRKKNSAIHTIRNLVRATVISSPSESYSPTLTHKYMTSENTDDTNKENSNDGKDSKTTRRKKYSTATREKKLRKKRNRRSRAIQNEGAPLWKPVDSCYWRSAGGRCVRLEDTALSRLCDAERIALKKTAINHLNQYNLDCTITIPKEHHAAARRRWKQLLNLKKKTKGGGELIDKGNLKLVNPVFCIDLFQVIENDKAAERAHKDAMARLDRAGEPVAEEEEVEEQAEEMVNDDASKNNSPLENVPENKLFERRNSDPVLFERAPFSYDGSREFDEASDYMLNALRTIDTLREVEEEEDSTVNKRRSRLIEALTLSSTSASSICVLDREQEFKPPPSQVPKVMIHATDYLETYALNTVGVFRTGGSKKRVRQMKEDYDNGYACVITEESNPHDVAALFKEFLRCLPEPLLTRELYQTFLSGAKQLSRPDLLECIKQLIWLLPAPNRDTLEITLRCLRSVADNSQDKEDEDGNLLPGNKMDSQNLATLMAPNILHRCKTYKNPQAYKVDESLNPEDNKAAIDAVEVMVSHNEELFTIPAEIHHEILCRLNEDDPETVDYILRRKSTRSSFIEVLENEEEEIDISTVPPFTPGRRPSSAGPRTKFSYEEVAFQKSNSFNQGPYKPFVRRRKESAGSRPTSTRSDPPDRNSIRRSGLGTPPTRHNRKSSTAFEETESKRNSSSPRDSGVVVSNNTPPFQRNSFQRNSLRSSFDARRIVLRQQSRDRDSRDSAYDSGMQGMFSNRTSAATSIHITEDSLDFTSKDVIDKMAAVEASQNNDGENSPKTDHNLLTDVLETPSFRSPAASPTATAGRKISLPAFSMNERPSMRIKCKSTSVDGDITLSKSPRTSQTLDWNVDGHWPEWNMNPRESQFPSQETTL